MDNQLTPNFKLSEFNNVMPHPALLALLQALRERIDRPITITDSTRTPGQHVETYLKLEAEHKIYTLSNGLGSRSVWDMIPWGSKHLPCFETPYLRAIDFIAPKGSEKVTGKLLTKHLEALIPSVKKVYNTGFGIGTGHTYVHLDVRPCEARWEYGY